MCPAERGVCGRGQQFSFQQGETSFQEGAQMTSPYVVRMGTSVWSQTCHWPREAEVTQLA